MALQDTDLFVVYRPATDISYKLQASDLGSGIPDGTTVGQLLAWNGTSWVPAAVGTEAGQLLQWSGTEWIASSVIDGGTY